MADRTQRADKDRCNAVQHMDDPWYMVFCGKKKGHRGLHAAYWKEDPNG